MTELLKRAIREVEKLLPDEQDVLAQLILDEIEGEARWNAAFEESAHILQAIGERVWQDHLNGKTTPLDPDTL